MRKDSLSSYIFKSSVLFS